MHGGMAPLRRIPSNMSRQQPPDMMNMNMSMGMMPHMQRGDMAPNLGGMNMGMGRMPPMDMAGLSRPTDMPMQMQMNAQQHRMMAPMDMAGSRQPMDMGMRQQEMAMQRVSGQPGDMQMRAPQPPLDMGAGAAVRPPEMGA